MIFNKFFLKKDLFKYLKLNQIECLNIFKIKIIDIEYKLYLNMYVFKPRIEFYIWVNLLNNLKILNKNLTILELGVGTCIMSLFLKKINKNNIIFGVDVNLNSIKLSVYNCKLNLLKINLFLSDWFNKINYNKKFSLIISNPPYISNRNNFKIKLFDPFISLYSKNSGYYDLYKIISFSRFFLKRYFYLIVEHSFNQGFIIRKIFKKFSYKFIYTIQDYNGLDRITIGRYY